MKPIIINGKITNYFIDEQGNIYNSKTHKYLQGSIKSGYKTVKLTIDNIKKDYLIHRLVIQTFMLNKNYKELQVNHKDGNKENNSINNLEKITNSENMLHSYYILKQNTTKVSQYLINGEYINSYQSLSEAERKTGFLASGISQVLNGKLKTYKGFVWKKE